MEESKTSKENAPVEISASKYYHIKYQFTLPELIRDLKKKKESPETIAKLESISQTFETFRYGTEQDNINAAKEIIKQIKEMIREI